VQNISYESMNKLSQTIKSGLVATAFYIFLPNLLYWVVTAKFGIDRPLFNLDYLFSGLLFTLGWRKISTILLGIFLIIDLLVLVGLLYPFVRLQDVSYLLSFLPYAGFAWQAAAAGLVLTLALLIGVSHRYGHKVNRLAMLILFNLGIAAHATHVYSGQVNTDLYYRMKNRLVNSQTLFFANTRATNFLEAFNTQGNPLTQIGFKDDTAAWLQSPPEKLNAKLLLIIAESWGVMKDERIQETLLAPLLAKQAHFDWIKYGQRQGATATVAAELQELCGLGTHHYNLKPVTEGFEDCLPAQLKQRGYSTAAIHGSVGVMYDRIHWYPRAGFDEIHFNETDSWETRCYSFPGVCDREIMDKYISHAFDNDEKRFVYWLTLNTHALYDQRDLQKHSFFDCTKYQLVEGSEVCRMNKLHAQFFHQLAETLTQPSMRGVEVIIVGDHPPRILDQDEKQRSVKEGMVSRVHLKVKS
jgi:phosphoglycerol transferase MdoB-like AlkP superfamily enzyme